MTWIPFLFILLLGGLILAIIAGMGAGLERMGLQRTVTVEEQLSFTVSSSSALQLPNTVLSTEIEHPGMEGKMIDVVTEFVYCHEREDEMNCPENYMDKNRVIRLLDYQTEWIFDEENLLEKPYFVRIVRDGDNILNYARGDLDLVFSREEGMEVPQFRTDSTVIQIPLDDPSGSSAYIEYHVAVGGLEARSGTGGSQ